MVAILGPYKRGVTLLALTVALCGCGKLDFNLSRGIEEQRVEGSVVSSLTGGVFDNPIPMNVDIERETEKRDGGPADSVHLRSLSLSITDTARSEGDEDTFDFLDQVQVFIDSKRSDRELSRKKIAERTRVPEGATELDLKTFEDVDLLPYINEGAQLTSEAQGNAPPDDVTFDGRFVLHVDVL